MILCFMMFIKIDMFTFFDLMVIYLAVRHEELQKCDRWPCFGYLLYVRQIISDSTMEQRFFVLSVR